MLYDQTEQGGILRILTLIDEYTKECTTNMNREEFANLIRQLEDYRIAHQHTYSELADLLGCASGDVAKVD